MIEIIKNKIFIYFKEKKIEMLKTNDSLDLRLKKAREYLKRLKKD